jgi:hypothetical protein
MGREARWGIEKLEPGVAALMCLGVLGVTTLLQARSVVEWDGAAYYEMARQVAAGSWPVHAGAPFVFRIAPPWLAGRLSPSDLTRGFLVVSWPAIVLQAVMLHLLLRRFIRRTWVRLLCVAIFLGQFHSLARFIPFRPHMIDPLGALAIFTGYWLIEKWRERGAPGWMLLLAVLVFAGTFCRESVLIVALAAPFARGALRFEPGRRLPRLSPEGFVWVSLLPLACWTAAMIQVRRTVIAEGGSMLPVLLRNAWGVKTPTTLALAFVLTFGLVGTLPLFAWRASLKFLRANPHHAVAIAATFAIAVAGGSDLERLASWAAPLILVLVGRLLDQRGFRAQAAWLLPLLVVHALGQRWFLLLPQSGGEGGIPLLTMWGADAGYESLWTEHMGRRLRLILSGEYLAVFAAMCAWFRRRGLVFA